MKLINYKYNHGLIVARFQPFHLGHIRVIQQMLSQCKIVTIIIGSTQEYSTKKNPLKYEQRLEIIETFISNLANTDKNRIKVSGQPDINNDDSWAKVVIKTVTEIYGDNYIPIDAYFAGTLNDSKWYKKDIKNIIIVDRQTEGYSEVSGTNIRNLYCNDDEKYLQYIPEYVVPYLSSLVCDKQEN